MDGSWLYEISHYAPLVILVAATLDIFFLTGLFLYGAAMMSTVLMMHLKGLISTEALIAAATTGTIIGNIINYWVGRLFGTTGFVKKRLEKPRLKRAQDFLRTRGLLPYIAVGRFVTFTRPLYALLLGSLKIKFHRFLLYEIPVAIIWATFWLLVLLEGEYWVERFWS